MMDGGSPRDIGLEPQIVHNRPQGRHVTLAQRRGLTNIRFEVRDAAKLDDERRFDAVFTFDAIHDQIDPHAMLDGVHRALKSGGLLLAQDIRSSSHLERNLDHPVSPFLYTISTMHCMTVSLAHCGCGLGTCWGEESVPIGGIRVFFRAARPKSVHWEPEGVDLPLRRREGGIPFVEVPH